MLLKTQLKRIPAVRGAVAFARALFTPRHCTFSLADGRYKVVRDRFWRGFAKGRWEPHTREVFQQNIDADTAFFDIGCWIGPTIFFANEAHAKSILAVEANPATFATVTANCALNRRKLCKHSIQNACISDRSGCMVPFGASPGRESDTSCCSTKGSQYQVQTIRLSDLFAQHREFIGARNFIKIDIEGSESQIIEEILEIPRHVPQATILLSLHPPFWESLRQSAKEMLKVYSVYQVFDLSGKPLADESLYSRMTWEGDSPPPWSTHRGNFFEVLLKRR